MHDDVAFGVESRVGAVQFRSRYHTLPKTLSSDYALTSRVLGKGCNGDVLLATSNTTKRRYAVKSLELKALPDGKQAELKQEAQVMLCTDHPHIAQVCDVYESDRHLHFVMECLEGGELYDRVIQKGKLPEHESRDAIRQMLLVLAYLHGRGIVHRDIKLENFLFDEADGDHLKLVDFGLSAFYRAGDAQMQSKCGTIDYVAPEVLKGGYTSQCDMWSLGVVAFILLSGGMPFNGKHGDARRKIMTGAYNMREEKWAPISQQGRSFVRSLLDMDPTRRLTAQSALMHPWIASTGSAGGGIESSVLESLRAFPLLPRFRRCCLSVLAWSLSRNDQSHLRDAFLAMDTRRRGVITADELRNALVDQFGAQEHEVIEVLASIQSLRGQSQCSVDSSSEIRYSEFLAAMVPSKVALNDDLLRLSFRRFDACGSGRITPQDLRRVVGNSFDGMDVDALMYEVSYTKDRSISYPEFVDLIQGSPKQNPKRPPQTPQRSSQQPPLASKFLRPPQTPQQPLSPDFTSRHVFLPQRRSHDEMGAENSKGGRSCCTTGGSNECSFM